MKSPKQRDGSASGPARKKNSNKLLLRRESFPVIRMQGLAKEEGKIWTPWFPSKDKLVTLPQIVLGYVPKINLSNQLETQLELQKSAKVGCRISLYHMEWMKINSDERFIKIVHEGVKPVIVYKTSSRDRSKCNNVQNAVQKQCILEEIETFLEKKTPYRLFPGPRKVRVSTAIFL